MTQRFCRSLVASLFVSACIATAVSSLWRPAGHERTADRHRPGHLSEVIVDTNFDGRSDVHEYYEDGALVRRESDRDFNDRVDLIQEFDATTREHARSVVDVDFDGRADLLVLFQDGKPVFRKWASPITPGTSAAALSPLANALPGEASSGLAPLDDPFAGDLAVKTVRVATAADDCVGLSSSVGLPASCADVTSPLVSSSDLVDSGLSRSPSAAATPYSPRGPPASRLRG